jgi:hypothetical protein
MISSLLDALEAELNWAQAVDATKTAANETKE